MKGLALIISGIIIMFISLYLLLNIAGNSLEQLGKSIDESSQQYKSHLSKRYILDDDTLRIIDYSMLNEQFTLSNGTKINAHIVFNDSINVIK